MNSENYYWWKASKYDSYKSLFDYLKYLERNQTYRSADNLMHMRLYGNMDILGLGSYNYLRSEPSYSTANRLTLNIIQSMVDTVVSKITKNKPKPSFLTSGGDWQLQRKAKKLTKFIEGQFYSTEFYEKSAFAFLDACIFGTGAIKIYKENNQVKAERVFIDEIIVDDAESIYGKPRQILQKKYIHKDVLKEMFPSKAGAIDAVDTRMYGIEQSRPNINDMVLVVEAWKLPSGQDSNDGKHGIYIENETLFEEKYNKDYFPFVFFKWNLRPLGFYGQGLSEQLKGLQVEINKILRTIQISMHLVSIPKLFVEASSKVVTAHLNNKIGGIIKYAGTRPTYDKLGAIPTELFTHLDRLYSRAYEIAGISSLSATSMKPSGLNSGKALREYNDLETERFMSVAQRYEKSHMDAAKIMIDMAKEIYEDTGEFKVKVKGKKFLETIDWSDIDLAEDQYMMQVFPTSALSQTPSGRLSDVQDLLAAGFINKEYATKLLDFPDLEQYYNLNNSGVEDIDKTIEMIVDKGEYLTPEPYQNLEFGIKAMQQAYLHYKTENLPEDRLELMRRWMSDANDLIEKAVQASQPQEQGQLPVNEQAPIEQQIAPVEESQIPPSDIVSEEEPV
jgi:hypothetical protein